MQEALDVTTSCMSALSQWVGGWVDGYVGVWLGWWVGG